MPRIRTKRARDRATEPRVDVKIGRSISGCGRDYPYQTVLLAQRQLGQRRTLGPHLRKTALVGDPGHLAGEIVGPGMIRAGEQTSAAGALGHFGASVPAYIQE